MADTATHVGITRYTYQCVCVSVFVFFFLNFCYGESSIGRHIRVHVLCTERSGQKHNIYYNNNNIVLRCFVRSEIRSFPFAQCTFVSTEYNASHCYVIRASIGWSRIPAGFWGSFNIVVTDRKRGEKRMSLRFPGDFSNKSRRPCPGNVAEGRTHFDLKRFRYVFIEYSTSTSGVQRKVQ